MYLGQLWMDGVKHFRNFKLDLGSSKGRISQVTVLIGENGCGKSTVLQAIALAAAGGQLNNSIDSNWVNYWADRREQKTTARVHAAFWHNQQWLLSAIEKVPIMNTLEVSADAQSWSHFDRLRINDNMYQPGLLIEARKRDAPSYFVAAYGTTRFLPNDLGSTIPPGYSVDRLRPLFPQSDGSGKGLRSLKFVDHFADKNLRLRYARNLATVLKNLDLFPELKKVELRGAGGVQSSGDLANRFVMRTGKVDTVSLTAWAMSHGFQSSLAWISDLIGQLMLDGQMDPHEATGLVLVDEIDLYLHPPRQARLLRALKKTFPKLQFIVSTHSPLVLCGVDPTTDRVVRLGSDPTTGNVIEITDPVEDPRLLTSGQLLQQYFAMDAIHPDVDHRLLRDYVYLAANPFRSTAEDRKLDSWEKKLHTLGVRLKD